MVVHFHAVAYNAFGHVFGFATLLGDFFDHSQFDPNGGAGVHGLGEPTIVDAVVQEHRALAGFHEQACGLAEDVISVGHPALEHRPLQARFVHVCVKVVSGHVGEIHNVRFRDGVPCGGDGVANLQVFEVLSEDVGLAFWLNAAWLVLLRQCREHGGVALDGRALHVMFDAPQAAHLFTASSSARSAVHKKRHGGAVSSALFGAVPVQHQNSTVHVRCVVHELTCHLGVVCGDAATQRAEAPVGERHRFFHVVVRHHGAHRTEGFHFVHGHRVVRVAMLEQHGRQEGSVFRVVGQHIGLFVLAKEPFGFLLQARHLVQHVLHLGFPDQRPHADPLFLRVADLGLLQLGDQRGLEFLLDGRGHKHATHCGAFLTTLDGHLFSHLFDKQVKLGGARHSVRSQNGGVQGVRFHVERHSMLGDAWVLLQGNPCRGGPRKRHHIPLIDVVQNVPCRSAHQLQRPRREDAAFVDGSDHRFGQEARDCGGFDYGRNAGQPIDRHLLQHAPYREVERVDVHRNSPLRDQEVVAAKRAFFAQRHKFSVGGKRGVGQPPPQAGVGKEVADAAFDVNPGVDFGRACRPTHCVELVFHAMEVKGKSFEHAPAFLESHLAKGRATDLSRKTIGRFEVDAVRGSHAHHVSCDRVVELRALPLAFHPTVFDQILYLVHVLWLFNEGTDSPACERSAAAHANWIVT